MSKLTVKMGKRNPTVIQTVKTAKAWDNLLAVRAVLIPHLYLIIIRPAMQAVKG